MLKILRLIPVALRYLINVGPLLYEAVNFGIKVVKGIRSKKEKPVMKMDDTLAPKKMDPG